jgi:AAA family ATP:ADP antiporter
MTAFSGSFFSTVNLVSFLLQLLVTSRIIRYMGVRGALFILPVLALVNYSIIAIAPLLAVVRIGKIMENATDYSVQNTVRQALFLPTTREAKYKAKAAVDTFFTRVGDLVQAGIVFVGTGIGLGIGGFAWLNVALTGAWLVVAGQIAREHRKRTR